MTDVATPPIPTTHETRFAGVMVVNAHELHSESYGQVRVTLVPREKVQKIPAPGWGSKEAGEVEGHLTILVDQATAERDLPVGKRVTLELRATVLELWAKVGD